MPGAPRTNPAAAPRGAQADFAARLRLSAETLHERLSHRDTLINVIRSVNETLEPGKVAGALLGHIQEWFPAACHAVVGHEEPEGVSLVAERGLSTPFASQLLEVGRWVLDHNKPFMTANLQSDRRVRDAAEATVVAFPLRARSRPVGAVIALDPASSADRPDLPPSLETSLSTLLEVPGLALDTAVQLRRFEALSVTDDLT